MIGAIDPNPRHQGRGLEQLRLAGIALTSGVLEKESVLLNVGFNKWITTGMPWVIAKVAQSMDGRITRPAEEAQWLSNNPHLAMVHYPRANRKSMREVAEAILLTNEYRDLTLVYQGIGWFDVLKELGAKGVTRLLVEGGGDILGQLHDLRLLDELWCFLTPMLTAGNKPSFAGAGIESMADASTLHRVRYKRIGNDVLVTGYIR